MRMNGAETGEEKVASPLAPSNGGTLIAEKTAQT